MSRPPSLQLHPGSARWVVLFGVVFAGIVMVACTGAPDRRMQAENLQTEIQSMAGVKSASVDYENSFERGATVSIHVTVPTATHQQIADIVNHINEIRGDDFAEFDQSADFSVTPTHYVRVLRGATIDATHVADDAMLVRDIAARVPAGEITWGRSGDGQKRTLRIQDAHIPGREVLNAVRSVVGDTAVTVDIRPADAGPDDPLLTATFPFSAEQQQSVMNTLHGLPVQVWAVVIGTNAKIVNLSVGVHDPATTYQDLTTVIAATGAGTAHQLWLSYGALGKPAGGEKSFSGLVIVGGCGYPNTFGEQEPERFRTPAALDVQRRLRQEFDTCPK